MTYAPARDAIALAEQRIQDTFGDTVSVSQKKKTLSKFGRTDNVSSDLSTVMQLAGTEDNETYATSDSIDSIVCTDNAFTGTVDVEGLTISGSNFTFRPPAPSSNQIALVGNTRQSLGTSLARATRGVITTSTTLAEGQFIYIYDSTVAPSAPSGVPSDDTAVKLIVEGGKFRQSQKASTSVSSQDYWLVSSWGASIGANKVATAELYLQIRNPFTDEFRTISERFLNSEQPSPPPREYENFLIIPKNHDVRITAITVGSSPASSVTITSELSGYLAIITS